LTLFNYFFNYLFSNHFLIILLFYWIYSISARTPLITPIVQTVHRNATAVIHCTVPGRTDAILSWRLENGVNAADLRGVFDDGEGLLRIDHVNLAHVRHEYVCWAMYPKRADKKVKKLYFFFQFFN
jgi:hypothetical protein